MGDYFKKEWFDEPQRRMSPYHCVVDRDGTIWTIYDNGKIKFSEEKVREVVKDE